MCQRIAADRKTLLEDAYVLIKWLSENTHSYNRDSLHVHLLCVCILTIFIKSEKTVHRYHTYKAFKVYSNYGVQKRVWLCTVHLEAQCPPEFHSDIKLNSACYFGRVLLLSLKKKTVQLFKSACFFSNFFVEKLRVALSLLCQVFYPLC